METLSQVEFCCNTEASLLKERFPNHVFVIIKEEKLLVDQNITIQELATKYGKLHVTKYNRKVSNPKKTECIDALFRKYNIKGVLYLDKSKSESLLQRVLKKLKLFK
jgi:hypothetical protein